MKWYVIYYEDINGYSKVFEYIESLKISHQTKVLNWIEKLEELGPNLPRPYADLLEDGIHELRIKISGKQIRIFYFFCYKDFIVLTHDFIKNTDKVPIREIKKAMKIRDEFLSRYSIEKLRKEYNENI
jgi:phage-related protein